MARKFAIKTLTSVLDYWTVHRVLVYAVHDTYCTCKCEYQMYTVLYILSLGRNFLVIIKPNNNNSVKQFTAVLQVLHKLQYKGTFIAVIVIIVIIVIG